MDFLDIFIIILALGASVVSAISKSSKKKKAGNVNKPQPSYDKSEDPWASIRELFEENREDPYIPARAEISLEEPESEDEVRKAMDLINERQKKTAAKRVARDKDSEIQTEAGISGDEGSHMAGMNEAVTEVVEHFDLRHAILYSEILKPKFKE